MGYLDKKWKATSKNLQKAGGQLSDSSKLLQKGEVGKAVKAFGQSAQTATKGTPVGFAGNLTKSVANSVADPLGSARDAIGGTMSSLGMDNPFKENQSGQPPAAPVQPEPTLGPYEAAYKGGTYKINPATALQGPENFQGIEGMRSVVKDNPWLGLAKQRQGLEEQQLLGSAGKLAAQSARQAQSNLAMRGGLRSGASERMARQGAMEQALAQQKVRGEGALTRAGFDVEGERMRQAMLGTLAGSEQGKATYQTAADQWNALQAAEADKWQKEQDIAEGIRKQDYGKYEFGEKAKMYGAGKTADAIARSGGTNSSVWNQLNPFAKA